MTRSTLRRTLRRLYFLLALVLGLSFFSKVAEHMPLLAGTGVDKLLKDIYEYLRDMSLLIATGGVAYVTNVFQKRSSFVDSLKEEWRDIIAAKSALLVFMHRTDPDHAAYVAAFTRLSETIDNMRVVYRNVGETDTQIGLYPFAPLHDMRRVLQSLDPRRGPTTPEQRKLARDTMVGSFYALRDSYLAELNLEAPDMPLLINGAKRLRQKGYPKWAGRQLAAQRAEQDRLAPPATESDVLLARLAGEEADSGQPAAPERS